ncbi:MAG: SDR family oxidoreductase [Proteobacteria bacterium]|nr:SDR family oxidoreductase [Pseudomonadota bacterium]
MKRILCVGARRGFGKAVGDLLSSQAVVYRTSRRYEDKEYEWKLDASLEDSRKAILQKIQQTEITKVFYFAGGGPYGPFALKQWKDHEWAWRVNFETPAFLLHAFLSGSVPQLEQVIFVGSGIAESQPDPGAASYSAAKHALCGLITSLQKESPPFDLRLFSPGYMDTEMLPPNARPRQPGQRILNPQEMAVQFLKWTESKDDIGSHLVIK